MCVFVPLSGSITLTFVKNACCLCPCQARLHLLACCSRASLASISATSIALVFTGYYFVDDKRSHTAWRSSCAPDYTLFRCYLLTFKLAWLMWMAVLALLLWCFTGYHFTHFWCCGVSLATISLTTSVLILHGARPARPYTHISNSYCDLLVVLSLPFTHISKAWGATQPPWLAGWLAGWPVGWLAARLLGWLAAWLLGWLAGWLAAWLLGWLAGWPVAWLAGTLPGCLLG